MEIKRENDVDEVTFAYRLLNLKNDEIDSIKKYLVENNLNYEINLEKGNVIIELENEMDALSVCKLGSTYKFDNNGIFVSLYSSYDHGGFTLPKFILKILKETDCGLDYSFVIY